MIVSNQGIQVEGIPLPPGSLVRVDAAPGAPPGTGQKLARPQVGEHVIAAQHVAFGLARLLRFDPEQRQGFDLTVARHVAEDRAATLLAYPT